MPDPICEAVRVAAIRLKDMGHTDEDVAEIFEFHTRTLRRILKRYIDTGDTTARVNYDHGRPLAMSQADYQVRVLRFVLILTIIHCDLVDKLPQ